MLKCNFYFCAYASHILRLFWQILRLGHYSLLVGMITICDHCEKKKIMWHLFGSVQKQISPLAKKLQRLQCGYCTWPYFNIDNISISLYNCWARPLTNSDPFLCSAFVSLSFCSSMFTTMSFETWRKAPLLTRAWKRKEGKLTRHTPSRRTWGSNTMVMSEECVWYNGL